METVRKNSQENKVNYSLESNSADNSKSYELIHKTNKIKLIVFCRNIYLKMKKTALNLN